MILLSSTFSSFIQLLGVLIIFILVLAITYFTTKWLGGLQKAQMKGKNLQTVETMRIPNNKYVQIIKAGEVYLVVAVGKDEVTLLTELTEEQLSQITDQEDGTVNEKKNAGVGGQETFQEVLNKFKERFPKKQD